MTLYYLWNLEGKPSGVIEADPTGPLPERCTPTPPPGEDYVWRGGWVIPEPPSLDSLKIELTRKVTALRWQHETGGIDVGGVRVATGIADQNRIASVLVAAPESVDFKTTDGWVSLSLAQLQAIAGAIAEHVQLCFSAERQHHEAIAALADVEAAQAYDVTAGWP